MGNSTVNCYLSIATLFTRGYSVTCSRRSHGPGDFRFPVRWHPPGVCQDQWQNRRFVKLQTRPPTPEIVYYTIGICPCKSICIAYIGICPCSKTDPPRDPSHALISPRAAWSAAKTWAKCGWEAPGNLLHSYPRCSANSPTNGIWNITVHLE